MDDEAMADDDDDDESFLLSSRTYSDQITKVLQTCKVLNTLRIPALSVLHAHT
jgi:hypothetical protein